MKLWRRAQSSWFISRASHVSDGSFPISKEFHRENEKSLLEVFQRHVKKTILKLRQRCWLMIYAAITFLLAPRLDWTANSSKTLDVNSIRVHSPWMAIMSRCFKIPLVRLRARRRKMIYFYRPPPRQFPLVTDWASKWKGTVDDLKNCRKKRCKSFNYQILPAGALVYPNEKQSHEQTIGRVSIGKGEYL